MSTMYRVKYKIVEGAKTYEGIRVIEKPIDEYMDFVHSTYSKASLVYLELIETFEQPDDPPETAGSILIISCAYDSFLP